MIKALAAQESKPAKLALFF